MYTFIRYTLLLLFFQLQLFGFSQKQQQSEISKNQLYENLAKIPVTFRENVGQWDAKILFQGSSPGWGSNVYFMKDHVSFGFSREDEEHEEEEEEEEKSSYANASEDKGTNKKENRLEEDKAKKIKDERSRADENAPVEPYEYMVWNLWFKNSNPNAVISAEGKTDSHVNYLIGNDFSKHRTNVPDYKMIRYQNIYTNIDVNYFSTGKNLKYDFILHPGAAIQSIELECEGIKNISINDQGQLLIKTPWGTLMEEIPESYQIINGEKKIVSISYKKINSKSFGFVVNGNYDSHYDLIIDPINFQWGTFVGGPGDGYISEIAVDPAGNVYGTGWYNAAFPTTAGVFDPSYNGTGGYGDAYIFKLNPTASTMLYATYLGGATSYEQGQGIAVNTAGEVYVAGWTQSTDFPTTAGSFDPTFNGTSFQDIFVTKLNAAGSALSYSTFVGGMYSDYAYSLDLSPANEVFVTGYSTNFNLDFPTTPGAYQASAATSQGGVYVFKLNAAGSALVYSTFTGNPSGRGYGVAINPAGEAYVTGFNYGNMDVTAGAFSAVPGAMIGIYPDAFAQKLNATGTALSYSTYLGGSNWEEGNGIDVDASGNAYVIGFTSSTDFPFTPGAYDVTQSGGGDPWLLKLNNSGTALVYGTFIGSNGMGYAVAVNSFGEAFICGNVGDVTLGATTCAYDNSYNGGTDCFVGKINASGNNALYLSYFGGNSNDYGNGPFGKVDIVLWGPCEDEVFTSITSHSVDFPTTAGTVQPVKLNSGADQPTVFHLKPVIVPDFSFVVASCNTVNFTDLTNGTCIWQSGPWTPTSWSWSFGDGGTSSLQNPSHTYAAPGTYNVKLVVSCPRDSIIIPVTVSSTGITLSMSSTPSGCGINNGTATATVTSGTGPFTYAWSPGGGNTSTITNLSAGMYTVVVTAGGCTQTDSVAVTSSGVAPVTSAITGPTPVCPNATGIVYSVINSVGSTYAWTVPAGATIVSGQGTNSITVDFGAGGGTISVTETNACGTGTAVNLNVTTNTTPVTSAITGTSPVCPNATNVVYSVTNTTGSTYAWTVPAGATIVSGQGTNSITVNWGATGGIISVTETSTCGTGAAVNLNVTVSGSPATGSISGSSPVCENATNVIYTVNNTLGSTYNWTVPTGATIVSGQGTNSIIVNWGTTAGNVSVTETNACGSGTAVNYPVTLLPLPSTSAISGSNPACANTNGVPYSVIFTGGSVYNWSVTGGGTIASGQGTNSITIDWGATGGTVTCTETNSCGAGIPVTYAVSFATTPITSSITGTTPVCPNETGTTYSVTNNTGSTYAWTVPAGATIVSGQGTNSIVVDWGTTGGTVSCIETNVCGSGVGVNIPVVMNALPTTGTITGPSPLCPNTNGSAYSVTNTAGSTYNWIVPAGATIVSGQGTNAIVVNWGTTSGNVSVTETNGCGNGTAVNLPVTIIPVTTVLFSSDLAVGCPPLTVQFTDNTVPAGGETLTGWSWIFGDGNLSSLQNPTNIYATGGSYNVTLTITTSSGCTFTTSTNNMINVYPAPNAAFTTNPFDVFIGNPVVNFVDQSQFNIVSWSWNFNDSSALSTQQNPTHTFPDIGDYNVVLTVTNQYGCIDTVVGTITIQDEFSFFIPSAFSPDGDGINENFRGYGHGIGTYEMWIFNRWGELIYETDEITKPWDGTTVKTAPNTVLIDVYVYKIRVTEAENGREHMYYGRVTVVK